MSKLPSIFLFSIAVYIDAPNLVTTSIDGGSNLNEERGWWFSDTEGSFRAAQQTDVSPGYSESLETIAEAFRELGPFDGRVLGSILSSFINMASI